MMDEDDSQQDDSTSDIDVDDKLTAPNYFLTHASRVKTSNNALKEEDLNVLQENKDSINYLESDALKNQLFSTYEKGDFQEMFFLLYEGANILVHGFGSKRSLIEKFCDVWLSDEKSLVIYGFFPEITMKHVLSYFKDVLEARDVTVEALYEAAQQLDSDLYIVIHSIDVLLSMSCTKLKPILVNLMTKSDGRMKLLGTVDHVHAGLMFNTKDTNALNLVWKSCPTMESYNIERGYQTSFEPSKSSLTGHLTLSAIEHVYECLNPNAQKIFIQILNYHLNTDGSTENAPSSPRKAHDSATNSDSDEEVFVKSKKKDESGVSGLPFSTLYRICREEYLVNSEITLKAQLTEFKDHKLLKVSKRSDGTQVVVVLVAKTMARKFLDKLEESL